ncbi:MAG: pseudouridine synthase [Gammaproteobacteria bacterium]|nr:pseudouridine synthase [Gammaproteobacteria bacterium]
MTTLIFNKPYGVLSQFSDKSDKPRPTLADYIDIPAVYPAGRLDYDSEGLLILTSQGKLQAQISSPRYKWPKQYWIQVEGIMDAAAVTALATGVELKDGVTLPTEVATIASPALWPRQPPIRYRAAIPTSWCQLTLREGRNRQARRMTAAVGFPTLRLVRVAMGPIALNLMQPSLAPGAWQEIDEAPLWRYREC